MLMNTEQPDTPPTTPPVSTDAPTTLGRLHECSVKYVRDNPVGTALGALAIGMVIGWVLPRREHLSWSERYLTRPAGRLKGWFVSASDQAADGLHQGAERAAEYAQDAAAAVGKGLRKLHFW